MDAGTRRVSLKPNWMQTVIAIDNDERVRAIPGDNAEGGVDDGWRWPSTGSSLGSERREGTYLLRSWSSTKEDRREGL